MRVTSGAKTFHSTTTGFGRWRHQRTSAIPPPISPAPSTPTLRKVRLAKPDGRRARSLARAMLRPSVRVIWRDPAIRALFLATTTLMFCMSFMASLYTLFALSFLGLSPAELGVTIGFGGT